MKKIILLLSLFLCTKAVSSPDFKDFISKLKTGNAIENLKKAEEFDKTLSEYNKLPLKLELKKIILAECNNFKANKGLESVLLGANVFFSETSAKELGKFYSIKDRKEQVINEKYSIHVDRNEIYLLTKDLNQKYLLSSFSATGSTQGIFSPDGKYAFISQSFHTEKDAAESDIKKCKKKFKSRFYEYDLKSGIHINMFSWSAYSIISIIDITNPKSPRMTEEFAGNFVISCLAVDQNMNLYLMIVPDMINYEIVKIPLGASSILMDLTITQLTFLIELNNNLNLIDQPIFNSIFDSFNPRFKKYLKQYFVEKVINSRLSKLDELTQIVNDYSDENN